MKRFSASLLLIVAAAGVASAMPSSKATCSRAATIECKVEGEDSPEAALRQVDEWALESMYCAAGCAAVINRDVPHAYATTIRPICSAYKHEDEVKFKKYKAKDDKDAKERRTQRSRRSEVVTDMKRRDIDAYTVQSATFQFCCTHPNGMDYTKEAGKYIGLELSICKQLL
ncbi:uncharacterized protein SPSC_04422 [Sporisorium scitamineum]|uniref:Uncharacterized protein n=1 Tax=Sporisorium scitamineum TaxID=49012 RepID=A0A0F7S1Z0_9BASI|nr:uncharacterized protein SPSC_04422 [Sporisorium scitamineum]CDS00967.1 hypothetical protein [Sporisorium scitamineum]